MRVNLAMAGMAAAQQTAHSIYSSRSGQAGRGRGKPLHLFLAEFVLK